MFSFLWSMGISLLQQWQQVAGVVAAEEPVNAKLEVRSAILRLCCFSCDRELFIFGCLHKVMKWQLLCRLSGRDGNIRLRARCRFSFSKIVWSQSTISNRCHFNFQRGFMLISLWDALLLYWQTQCAFYSGKERCFLDVFLIPDPQVWDRALV